VFEMREVFDRRRRKMIEILSEIDGFTVPTPKGAFYCYPSVEGVIGREIAGTKIESSADLAEVILNEAKVAVVPGEAFGPSGFIRLSYALGDDDLVEGVTRIKKLINGEN
jgi:aspartate/methionine/tyrosine aminotransferase